VNKFMLLIVVFLIVSSFSTLSSEIVFASPENWIEVTRVTGKSDLTTTESFTCDHVKWRIRWEYIGSEYALFNIHTYSQEEKVINSIINGANVEVTLIKIDWALKEEVTEPDDQTHYILEANVWARAQNTGELPAYNVKVNLMFNITIWRDPCCIFPPELTLRERTVNIGTLTPNETERITETFVLEESLHRMRLNQVGRDAKWDVASEKNSSGVSYIHHQEGTFYMNIRTANIESFTIIVEQDLNSIPEFPSWTPFLILLVVVLAVAVVYRRRLHKQNQRREEQ